VALAGCGSSTPAATGEKPGDGKLIFTDSCGGCHTLDAAGTKGGTGPNLTTIGLTSGEVAKQVQNGGGGMPAFQDDLTERQISAVAAFVDANDGSD
jgi:mono/diheme cytochrome c family protein